MILQKLDRMLLWVFATEVSARILTYPPPGARGVQQAAARPASDRDLRPNSIRPDADDVGRHPHRPRSGSGVARSSRSASIAPLCRTAKLFRYANPFQGLTHAFEEDRLLFTFAFSVLGTETILGGISLFLGRAQLQPGNQQHWRWACGGHWSPSRRSALATSRPVTTVGRFIGGAMMIGGLFTLALCSLASLVTACSMPS